MGLNVELYINGERVELFKDESISFTSNIKSSKNIDKLLADFSQQFVLPASKVNNKIFKHYYKYDIINGYDARFKVDAFIKLNGIGFRDGTLRLNKVELRDGQPFSYKVVFFGKSVNLKTRIGNDTLTQLTYIDRFQHEYNSQNVFDGLGLGLGFENVNNPAPGTLVRSNDKDIIYPLITHTRQYYYDSVVDTDEEVAGTNISDIGEGIDFLDLKPAIKLIRIIEAIEAQYDIEFSRDFFGLPEFEKLYMWMHRSKGNIRAGGDIAGDVSLTIDYEELISVDSLILCDGNNAVLTPITPENILFQPQSFLRRRSPSSQLFLRRETYFTVNVEPTELDKDWSIRIFDDITGREITTAYLMKDCFSVNNPTLAPIFEDDDDGFPFGVYTPGQKLQGNRSVTFIFKNFDDVESNNTIKYTPRIVFSTDGNEGVSSAKFKFFQQLRSNTEGGGFNYIRNNCFLLDETKSVVETIYGTTQMPDFKVIDFIKSLFKMFNLVGYSNQNDFSDDRIIVDTLDSFYRQGKTIDISKYIKTDKHQVERLLPYTSIEYKYANPKTFLIKRRNEAIPGIGFGNLEYKSELLEQFDGGNYSIKVDFEHMLFERLTDLGTGDFSNVGWGWFVDDKRDPTVGKPLIFVNEPTNSDGLRFNGQGVIVAYNRPSNSINLFNDDNYASINFDSEIDEFNLELNENGLFQLYHSNFINKIYDTQARKISISAVLPPNFLLNFNLNDVLTINNRAFTIEKIKSNLSNGESTLELKNVILDKVVRVDNGGGDNGGGEETNIPELTATSVNVGAITYRSISLQFDDTQFNRGNLHYYVNGVRNKWNSGTSPIFSVLNVGDTATYYITDDTITSETVTITAV